MLHRPSPVFDRLYERIAALPVIDCHEHTMGPEHRAKNMDNTPELGDPLHALFTGYVASDGDSTNVPDRHKVFNLDLPLDERWPIAEEIWRRTEHTAYARVTKIILREVYGIEKLDRAALDVVRSHLENRNAIAFYNQTLDDANIHTVLTDVLGWYDFGAFLKGDLTFPDRWRVLISGLQFRVAARSAGGTQNFAAIQKVGEWAGGKHITSLAEYEEAMFEALKRGKERGAVGIKDQSAYNREIAYELVPRADAERLFNRVLTSPRYCLGWPEGRALDDYLFHHMCRCARDLDLPVQLHTGHMAGIRNDIAKTNAVHLTNVLELHQGVTFDLFHGNWPYLGEWLFLGKNYPNVTLDFCWLHIIDPDYAIEAMVRGVQTLPHTKIHGFGGDYGDVPEYAAAHLRIARENIAAAMTDLVERGWLEEDQAVQIAADWLFNNPNRTFKLGFDEVTVS